LGTDTGQILACGGGRDSRTCSDFIGSSPETTFFLVQCSLKNNDLLPAILHQPFKKIDLNQKTDDS
jgi:hypothetical protein